MEGRHHVVHAPRKPRSLKEIVRIERRVHDTIDKTWVRIAERDLLCRGPLLIEVPFYEIARQCAKACKEMRAKKRRTPPDDRTVSEMMSHEGDGKTIIVNRSSPRTAVRDRAPLVAYSIGDTPVFKNIMRKWFFPLKPLCHGRIAHKVSHIERLPVIDALLHHTHPIMILNIQLSTT